MSTDCELGMNTHSLRRTRHPVKVYLCRSIVLLFAGVLALTITSQDLEASSRATVVQQQDRLKDPTFISDGARLFAPSCGNAYCHGTAGAGGGAPRLRGRELDAAYLFKTISNGIPGTGMLSFKTELSEDRIWKLVAFIMSDPKSDPAVKAPVSGRVSSISRAESGNSAPAIAASSLIGDPQAGRALFFDSTQVKSCQSCHSFSGEGKPIGPDLSSLEKKSPRELFLNIVLVGESKDPRYATVTVTLKNGDKITGVKKDEDAESIRVFDTTELPAVLRTAQKADVLKFDSVYESVMPKDYASIYTMKQLLDLVTFLKSAQPKSTVTLNDLLQ